MLVDSHGDAALDDLNRQKSSIAQASLAFNSQPSWWRIYGRKMQGYEARRDGKLLMIESVLHSVNYSKIPAERAEKTSLRTTTF